MPTPTPDTDELIRIYKNAQANIIRAIIEAGEAGNISVFFYQQQLLEQINRELAILQNQTAVWVNTNMPIAYQQGVLIADQQIASQFKAAGIDPPVFPSEFGIIDREQILSLVSATQDTFDNMIQFTGSQLTTSINEAVADAIQEKISTGATLAQAQATIATNLELQGIQSVAGMQLDSYAAMIARSTTAEATNQAVLRRVVDVNGDLVKMSTHFPTCPICFPLQGRVYSITGQTPGYPRLEVAYSGGFANIHPNCKHRLLPYIPELKSSKELERDQEFSNRPFDIDNMSPQVQSAYNSQLDVYNAGQANNREVYFNRKQWGRYLARLGSEAPQTFSGFMRIKNAASESWRKLQAAFRTAGIS